MATRNVPTAPCLAHLNSDPTPPYYNSSDITEARLIPPCELFAYSQLGSLPAAIMDGQVRALGFLFGAAWIEGAESTFTPLLDDEIRWSLCGEGGRDVRMRQKGQGAATVVAMYQNRRPSLLLLLLLLRRT